MNFPLFLSRTTAATPTPLLIALDPGETTGYAIFEAGVLIDAGQLDTRRIKLSVQVLTDFFDRFSNTPFVVFENYKVYAWKTESHAWATLHTPQLLGVIETLCYLRGWKTARQMAQQPKQFCTDIKLKTWGYYRTGEQHARDAIRHGCYYLLFNNGK